MWAFEIQQTISKLPPSSDAQWQQEGWLASRLAVLVSLVLVLVVVDGPRTYQPWEGAQISKVPQYPSTPRTKNGLVTDMNLPAEQ